MPVMPVKLAGWRIEPPVSVPVAAGTRRAATAAAEPPDEPPGTRVVSHGFATGRGRRPSSRCRAHRELVAVQLAERDHARIRQARDHGRVEGAAVALEHLRAGRGGQRAKSVTKMSLWASGTPSSAPRSAVGAHLARRDPCELQRNFRRRPRESRRVASWWAMRASSVFRQLRRSKLPWPAARGPIRPRPSRDAAALHALDHLAAPGTGRLPQTARCAGCLLVHPTSVTTIVAQPQRHFLHRRQRRVQRLDAAGVDRAHLLDDAEEAVESALASRPARRAAVRGAPAGRCGSRPGVSVPWVRSGQRAGLFYGPIQGRRRCRNAAPRQGLRYYPRLSTSPSGQATNGHVVGGPLTLPAEAELPNNNPAPRIDDLPQPGAAAARPRPHCRSNDSPLAPASTHTHVRILSSLLLD